MTPPRKVLVAYDATSGAKRALEELKRNRAGLPKDVEALVLYVADVWSATTLPSFGAYGWGDMPATEPQLEALAQAERRALKNARAVALAARQELRAGCPGWEVRAESCAASPAWGIIKRAEEWSADLIVMGSHGRSALGRLVLGSVSQAVVREAPCAVRIVRGRVGKRGAPVCVLIGYDGSPDADAAVQAVADRLWPAGSAVRLVAAIGDPLAGAIPTLRWIAAHEPDEGTWIRRMMDAPAERLRAAGLSVSTLVRRGDPRKVLADEAQRWDADSLFVGARGLRGVKRFLLGSVSTALAMRAPCPVEVIRPALRRRAPPESLRRSGQLSAAGSKHG